MNEGERYEQNTRRCRTGVSTRRTKEEVEQGIAQALAELGCDGAVIQDLLSLAEETGPLQISRQWGYICNITADTAAEGVTKTAKELVVGLATYLYCRTDGDEFELSDMPHIGIALNAYQRIKEVR